MEKKNNPIILFDKIEIEDSKTLNDFILNMDYIQSIYMLLEVANKAHRDGILNIVESEIISKAIRIVYLDNETRNESEG